MMILVFLLLEIARVYECRGGLMPIFHFNCDERRQHESARRIYTLYELHSSRHWKPWRFSNRASWLLAFHPSLTTVATSNQSNRSFEHI